jgi:hypothetical protein
LFSFTKLENRKAEQVLPGALVPVGWGRRWGRVWEGEYSVHIYVNWTVIPVETIPGVR